MAEQQPNLDQRIQRSVKKLLIAATLMFGFGFAMVPLYNVICDVTGLNGKTSSTAADASTQVDETRTVEVQFVTQTDAAMPWEFRPETRSVKVHPGEIKLVNFYAKNDAADTVVGQAVPSVSPGLAAGYLKKTQCFCFDQQTLAGGKAVDMPVIFYLDPALPKNITQITLSYTLYNVTERAEKSKDLAATGGNKF
ncbi:MAG: cytochrome c oxidase assembly protein [Alcanivoracaceae bacterium]|nr:cytochrome c oxidase assembly protein [Alcanivoracaceae bacterium]